MAERGTSEYWRNLLELDKPVPPGFLPKASGWFRVLRTVFYAAIGFSMRFYCRTKIIGLENLPKNPPYIIAPNHASSMDYVLMAWAMGKRKGEMHPVATKLFFENAFAHFFIKVVADAIKIDTENDPFSALRTAARVLTAGGSVYIQPEGLRSMDGKLLPFHSGVGVLAVESGAPLVPVYLKNTWKVLPPGRIFLRPYPLTVSIGKPMEMQPYIEKKKTVQAYDVYKEVTEELRNRILSLSQSPC